MDGYRERRPQKIRSEETWAEVRRAWEQGETAASLVRRYDVGLANLWRRRASEGWRRLRTGEDPTPEPVEGWERHGRRQLEAFERRREDARELADLLMAALADERLKAGPLWHIPWLYKTRAERLGPEAAARDRARAIEADLPWADAFWLEDGRLKPLWAMDEAMARLHPDELRAELGLP